MYYYIVNPAAGGGMINSIQDRLKATLNQLKIDGEFAKTLGPGDASKVTETALAKGAKTIVAVGGSETVNEVIAAVHRAGHPEVAIGIVPTGKQNWLAQYLGINNWREAGEILAARRVMEYKLMTVNDQVFIHFLNLAAHQPEPEEAETEPSWWSKLGSRTAAAPPLSYKIEVDGAYKIRGQTDLISIHNLKFLDADLPNGLRMRLESPRGQSGLRRRLGDLTGDASSPGFSQLIATSLELRLEQPAEAVADGTALIDQHFRVAMTDQYLRLIAKSARAT